MTLLKTYGDEADPEWADLLADPDRHAALLAWVIAHGIRPEDTYRLEIHQDDPGYLARVYQYVHKLAAYVPMTPDEAMEWGLVADTRPPAPAVVRWWRRARLRVSDAIAQARLRVGAWVAGVHPSEWED